MKEYTSRNVGSGSLRSAVIAPGGSLLDRSTGPCIVVFLTSFQIRHSRVRSVLAMCMLS